MVENRYGTIREKYTKKNGVIIKINGYEGRMSLGKNLIGKQNQMSFYDKTVDGVKKQMDDFRGIPFTSADEAAYHLKVKDWTDYWYNHHKKHAIKDSTKSNVLRQINLINDTVGEMFIQRLMEYNLQQVINMRIESGVKSGTVNQLTIVIKQCFKCAFRYGLLTTDITENLRGPRIQQKERIPLSREEDLLLKKAIEGDELEEYIIFLRGTAARKMEGLGICWQNVDFENHLIYFGKQLKKKTVNGKIIITVEEDTKNGVFAPVKAPGYVFDAMLSMKRKQEEWSKSNNKYKNKLNLVFTDNNGNPIDPSVVENYAQVLKERINRKDFSLHLLRHTRATEVYYETGDPLVVQALLRHRYLSSTFAYLHLIPGTTTMVSDFKNDYRNEIMEPIKNENNNKNSKTSILDDYMH